MGEKELSGQELKAFKDMESWLSSHRRQYKCVEIAAAISTKKEESEIITLRVLFLNESPSKDASLSYSGIELLKSYKSIDEGWTFIEKIIKDNCIEIDNQKIDVKGELKNAEREYNLYNSSVIPHITKWPGKGYNYEVREGVGYGPSGSLVKLGAPVYIYCDYVIAEWIGKKRDSNIKPFQHQVSFIFPDYSAKINSVKLHGKNITVNIKPGFLNYEDLILKYYLSDENYIKQDEIIISRSDTTLILNFVPSIIYVYILNKKTGEKIDWREINLRYDRDYDIQIEQAPETIEYLLEQGEGPQLEYKYQFERKSEFLETFVAFANTKGGRILVSVDDNGTVIGIEGSCDELISIIQDSVRNGIEPSLPEINIMPVEIQGKIILLIEVPEGDNKPYMLNQGGIVYVRAGGSDKRARRIDIDRLYQEKQNWSKSWPR